MRSGGLTILTTQVTTVVVAEALSEFIIWSDLRKGITVQGTLSLRVVHHPEEANSNPIKAMEVMFNILERNMASVAIFTV